MAQPAQQELTAREASYVASVDYKEVRRAFDDGALASKRGRRVLDLRAAFRLAVASHLAGYPSPVKERLADAAASAAEGAEDLRSLGDVSCHDGPVVTTMRASQLAAGLLQRMETIARLKGLISCDATVQGGAPVFTGSRILVRHIAGMVANGVPRDEILEDYPELTDDLIELAVLHDQLYPQRGRPRGKGVQRDVSLPD